MITYPKTARTIAKAIETVSRSSSPYPEPARTLMKAIPYSTEAPQATARFVVVIGAVVLVPQARHVVSRDPQKRVRHSTDKDPEHFGQVVGSMRALVRG